MRSTSIYLFAFALLLASSCMGQQWDVGASAGYGIAKDVTIKRNAESANAGFRSGLAFGIFGGQDLYEHVSGELRYTLRFADPRLESGAASVRFDGRAHAIHYDLLLHFKDRESTIRPFLAGGGGIRVFEGTGRESAVQPLSQFAILTKTREVKPMVSLGAGIRFQVSPHVYIRGEFRDYTSPFPREVIAPVGNARVGGWIHDFVPMIGVSGRF